MTDAASLAFWTRVADKAHNHWAFALAWLGAWLGTEYEMDGWEAVIRCHRIVVWAEIHRCMAERPRSSLWYVKAGA